MDHFEQCVSLALAQMARTSKHNPQASVTWTEADVRSFLKQFSDDDDKELLPITGSDGALIGYAAIKYFKDRRASLYQLDGLTDDPDLFGRLLTVVKEHLRDRACHSVDFDVAHEQLATLQAHGFAPIAVKTRCVL